MEARNIFQKSSKKRHRLFQDLRRFKLESAECSEDPQPPVSGRFPSKGSLKGSFQGVYNIYKDYDAIIGDSV